MKIGEMIISSEVKDSALSNGISIRFLIKKLKLSIHGNKLICCHYPVMLIKYQYLLPP
jgi:hypothetical protein